MQITIGTQEGETFQTEIEDSSKLIGKKIGDHIEGDIIGLEGYKLEITGGSDADGFPMRKSIDGAARRKVLIEEGSGINEERKGVRRRKSVRGNTISESIQQLNTQVVKEGSKSIEELIEDLDETE